MALTDGARAFLTKIEVLRDLESKVRELMETHEQKRPLWFPSELLGPPPGADPDRHVANLRSRATRLMTYSGLGGGGSGGTVKGCVPPAARVQLTSKAPPRRLASSSTALVPVQLVTIRPSARRNTTVTSGSPP